MSKHRLCTCRCIDEPHEECKTTFQQKCEKKEQCDTIQKKKCLKIPYQTCKNEPVGAQNNSGFAKMEKGILY